MTRTNLLSVAVILLVAGIILTGCTTMTVTMSPKVPQEQIRGKRIPVKVALYMTPEFRSYHWKEREFSEMSNLDYDLGQASKSLFIETFMTISKSLVIVDHGPPYAKPEETDISIVIEPQIVSFSQKSNPVLRIANYYAWIEYRVVVHDRAGNALLDKVYKGEGAVKGRATHSPGSNYAAPAEVAMSNAIAQIVDDICRLDFQKE